MGVAGGPPPTVGVAGGAVAKALVFYSLHVFSNVLLHRAEAHL